MKVVLIWHAISPISTILKNKFYKNTYDSLKTLYDSNTKSSDMRLKTKFDHGQGLGLTLEGNKPNFY